MQAKNLEELDLHNNQITQLSPIIGELSNLKVLNLSKNPVLVYTKNQNHFIMNSIEIQESCKLINQHFDLQKEALLPKNIDSLEELKNALTQVIAYLLDQEFERLLQIMYRIDVSEEKFKQAFQQDGNIAQHIAELVIERELEKVKTRLKYRNQ